MFRFFDCSASEALKIPPKKKRKQTFERIRMRREQSKERSRNNRKNGRGTLFKVSGIKEQFKGWMRGEWRRLRGGIWLRRRHHFFTKKYQIEKRKKKQDWMNKCEAGFAFEPKTRTREPYIRLYPPASEKLVSISLRICNARRNAYLRRRHVWL